MTLEFMNNLKINKPSHNFVLLQWLVVDSGAISNLLSLSRRTRPTSSDSPPMKATQARYAQAE